MKKNTFQIVAAILIVLASAYSCAFLTLSQKENIEEAAIEIKEKTQHIMPDSESAHIDAHLPDVSFFKKASDFIGEHLPAE